MSWFNVRQQLETTMPGILVSKVAAKLKGLAVEKARRYRCVPSTDTQFEILSIVTSGEYRVNIDTKICSCKGWQSIGIPCSHALCVILGLQQDPQKYVDEFYTL